jgi:hypothetical protein
VAACRARAVWAELVITEMSFPVGRHKELTDSTTQALKYLRDAGLAETDEEQQEAKIETVMRRPRLKRLYPC